MTVIEKEFLSTTVISALRKVENDRSRHGNCVRSEKSCIFCGGNIGPSEFLLMRENDGYIIGCLHCGGPRERFPNENPCSFSSLVRNRLN